MAFYSNIFYNNNTSNWCPLNIFENKGFIPKL
jgi:hypothetical protein